MSKAELGPNSRHPCQVLEQGGHVLAITVLGDTREVDGVLTRVDAERESEDGELVAVSRDLPAMHARTKDVGYFGEEVDDYEDGVLVAHERAWLSGQDEPASAC